ncbi:MAG: hypothetical protein ABJQ34_18995 [Paracoccaceae bacterium]
MKTLILSAITTVSASAAMANTPAFCGLNPAAAGCSTAVPEISALEGTAAIAALAAIVLLTWERRRRAA